MPKRFLSTGKTGHSCQSGYGLRHPQKVVRRSPIGVANDYLSGPAFETLQDKISPGGDGRDVSLHMGVCIHYPMYCCAQKQRNRTCKELQRQKCLTSKSSGTRNSIGMQRNLQPITNRDHVFQPLDLSAKWTTGVVSKVRSVRVAALSGTQVYQDGDYVLRQATGVLELMGHREGAVRTELVIGFSSAQQLPPPMFYLDEARALGTMSLPSDCFSAFLQVAQLTSAHFRISSNGELNALASDPAMFQQIREQFRASAQAQLEA